MTSVEQKLVRHSGLAERFSAVPAGGQFVVAQTAFGNGLDFLSAWHLWRQANAQPRACLHFLAAVSQPVDLDALIHAWARFTQFDSLASELAGCYPSFAKGTHRLVLDNARVRLTLYFGDISDAGKNLTFSADAWLISQSMTIGGSENARRQAAMTIARHSRSGTSLASDHWDRQLAELLSDAGFTVSPISDQSGEPALLIGEWPVRQEIHHRSPQPTRASVAIVGAGIAGCLLASNLARRGQRVTLIDQASAAGAGASGNRQGALYVKLGVDYNDQTELALSSLLFSQRFYRQFTGKGWHPTGLLQLAYSETEADRQARLLAKNQYPSTVFQPVTADQASRIAGIPIPHGGFWFPASGWLQPDRLCRTLAREPGIEHQMGFSVATMSRTDGAGSPHWQLTSSNGETLPFDSVVLCAGPDTPELIPLKGQFRMKPIRGQITEVPESRLNTPSVVVCGPGYVNPAFQHRALVGATFDLHDECPTPSEQSDQQNLRMLADLLPGAMAGSDVDEIARQSHGRVAFRCTTHDYQPVAGPMKTRDGDVFDGLYLFTGLGSKGLTYSPLLAEYLGDMISGQPPCLPGNLIKRLDTRRCHRPGAESR